MSTNKITTDDCKILIVDWCKANLNKIINKFIPPLPSSESSLSTIKKNWIRTDKCRHDNWLDFDDANNKFTEFQDIIMRTFDCKPFDDQLRAIVITNYDDTKVLFVKIEGE